MMVTRAICVTGGAAALLAAMALTGCVRHEVVHERERPVVVEERRPVVIERREEIRHDDRHWDDRRDWHD